MGIIYGDPASTSGYGYWQPVYIQGDAPVPVELEVAVNTSSTVTQYLTVAVAHDQNDLSAFLNGAKILQCESGTMVSADTTSTAVAAASGGNVARTTFATTTSNVERFRCVANSTLRGTYDVYLWHKPTATTSRDFYAQLRWGLGASDLAANVGEQVNLLISSADSFTRAKLGKVHVPDEGASALTLGVWLEKRGGSGSVDSDFLALVPSNAGDSISIVSDFNAGLDGQTFLLTEKGEAHRLTGGLPGRRLEVAGPATVQMNPGLNLLMLGLATSSTGTGATAFLTDTFTVSFAYSPRYYS